MRELMNIYLTRFGEEKQIFAPNTKWANVEQYDKHTRYTIEYKLFMHDEVMVGKYIGCTDGAKSLLFTDLSRPREHKEFDNTRHVVIAIPTQNINSIVIAK
jgi:hypothetical protein